MKYNERIYPLLFVLLFAAGCNYNSRHADNVQVSNELITADTTFASPADSLEYLVKYGNLPLPERMIICEQLSYDFIYNNLEKTVYYAELGLQLAEIEKNDSITGLLYSDLGMAYTFLKDFDRAQEYFEHALNYALKTNDENFESFLYNAFGKLYNDRNMLLTSIEYKEKAFRLAEKIGAYGRMGIILRNIGSDYYSSEYFDESEKYYLRAIEIYNTKVKNPVNEDFGDIYVALSRNYTAQGKGDEAFETAQKALEYAKASNKKYYEAEALIQCAHVYLLFRDDAARAMELAGQGYDLAEELDNDAKKTDALEMLGLCYRVTGDYLKSRDCYLQAFALTDPTEMRRRRNIMWICKDVLILLKETDEALSALQLYDSLSLAINSQKVQNLLSDFEIRYETEKKQIEIERQQNTISRQNMQRGMMAGGIAVCCVILALLWYLLRLRNRRNLALTERNDALAEMNAAKDKFFSIISHDLRNPVVAQRDALKMLVQNSSLWDAGTLAAYYRELLNTADGQVELVYNLLGWAQLQTGRITYNPATFNLAHRLRSDINLIRNMAEKKGVAFAVNIPEDADITGDASMLSIVVRNLLTNAVKFTEASPDPSRRGEEETVRLDVTPVYGDESAITGYTVTVSDTGVGMSAEQIGKLFRLDSARSRKGTAGEQGSGLGLIVCRELLEKHGCELHVESEEGKGSRFSFQLKIFA